MAIKVLVVDDSAFMRKVISDIINASDELEVIGTAKNGEDAIKKIDKLRPDVVTLDVEMPIMDGLTALEKIMIEMPLPVLMLSSYTKEGADLTLRCLELGAIDFIQKPSSIFKINTDDMAAEVVEKVLIASKAKYRKTSFTTVKKARATQDIVKRTTKTMGRESKSLLKEKHDFKKVVAIGTSTGGPRALQEVISNIPSNIDASIVIVQHMPPKFTKSLAERLNSLSEINVKEAEDGDVLSAGWAYLAPGDRHLRVKRNGRDLCISLDNTENVSGHKPSVDAMFYSIADLRINNVVGVIMTGMGADGADGIRRIKDENSGITISQDEESCVVFGMPKSAIATGKVDKIVSLSNISNEIIRAVGV